MKAATKRSKKRRNIAIRAGGESKKFGATGRKFRRNKTQEIKVEPPPGVIQSEEDKIPKSFVLKIGKVSADIKVLVAEMRRTMEPNTANKLRERKRNKLKDFIAVAKPLGVTHLCVINQTEQNLMYKISRLPEGPTLTFTILRFSLRKNLIKLKKRVFVPRARTFEYPPLVVLNNFGDNEVPEVKLMKVTFQNMYPSISIASVKVDECRRVVLYHYDKLSNVIEMRHYGVEVVPNSSLKVINKVVQSKIPDLHNIRNIAAFIENQGLVSDSEVEDEDSKIELPQNFVGSGTMLQKSRVLLQEIGPRLTMSLYKVERGLMSGDVLFHSYISKTPQEVNAIRAKVANRQELKQKRQEEQNANVARKKATIEEKKLEKMRRIDEKLGKVKVEQDEE